MTRSTEFTDKKSRGPSQHRGQTKIGWLNGHHSFSFGRYYDPRYMGVANLRVLNHDVIAPGGDFAPHPHRDMEIVTIVLRGGIKHGDNTGNKQVLTPEKVQAMSAGSGIVHSEFNASQTEEAELLQIWLLPQRQGLNPGYAEHAIPATARDNVWSTVASGRDDGGLVIHTDATIKRGTFTTQTRHNLEGRPGYLYVIDGSVTIGDQILTAGDAAIVQDEQSLTITPTKTSDLVLFDLAAEAI